MNTHGLAVLAVAGGLTIRTASGIGHRRDARADAERIREAAVASATQRAEKVNGDFVAVVIAALDEADSISVTLRSLPATVCGLPTRAVVVDDGSSDDTAAVAERENAIVARHSRNLGQGDGLRTGIAVALALGASIVVTMDADGQHDPAELPELVKPIITDEVDYVQGSRFLGSYDDAGGVRHAGIKGFTALINLLAGTEITDCANGYRAFRASGIARMRLIEDRFSASEIILEAVARGLRMREVPVHIRHREIGVSRKPRGLGYPIGYGTTILRVWARTRVGAAGLRGNAPSAHSASGDLDTSGGMQLGAGGR